MRHKLLTKRFQSPTPWTSGSLGCKWTPIEVSWVKTFSKLPFNVSALSLTTTKKLLRKCWKMPFLRNIATRKYRSYISGCYPDRPQTPPSTTLNYITGFKLTCTVWYDKSNNVNNNTTIDWKVEKALGIVSCFSIVLLNKSFDFSVWERNRKCPSIICLSHHYIKAVLAQIILRILCRSDKCLFSKAKLDFLFNFEKKNCSQNAQIHGQHD